MEYINKIVSFDEYCNKCEFESVKETENPCNRCLNNPVREHSHKPQEFREKKNGKS